MVSKRFAIIYAAVTLLALLVLLWLLSFPPSAYSQVTVDRKWTKMVGRATLLDAATTTGDGTWVGIEGFASGALHITGIAGDTVTISLSNSPTKPLDTSHDIEIQTVTEDTWVSLDLVLPARWLKVRMSEDGTGVVSAYFEGQQE